MTISDQQRREDFWSSVMLMTGRFKGSPMAVHAALPRAEPNDFERWLRLFHRTAFDVCPPDAAALFCAKAEMIAQSLKLGIAAHRGVLPPRPPENGAADTSSQVAANRAVT